MRRHGAHRRGLIRATPEAKNGDVVVTRFGDEVTLKRFVRLNERHVELSPDSHSPQHKPRRINLVEQSLHIDGIAVGGADRAAGQRRRLNIVLDRNSDVPSLTLFQTAFASADRFACAPRAELEGHPAKTQHNQWMGKNP